MRLFGLEITRAKQASPVSALDLERGWFPVVREPFAGAWQKNLEIRRESVLQHPTVYACVSLIAADIAKLNLRLVQKDQNGIWMPVEVPAFTPVLRKPNRYQNRIQFVAWWVTSLLSHGNTVVLKERDDRGVVVGLYILDPSRARPSVSPDGSVFYQLARDNLSGLEEDVFVPASEVIHDVMNPLFHPLCGISPIAACGMAALQGLNIQKNSIRFFANGARPGGILTAPGAISDETAKRLKEHWEQNFTGENAGRVAVLGDNLKYEAMAANAVDSQVIDQLKWSAETICSVFHVPAYMVGVGQAPAYNNIEALQQQYYSQCLQVRIESIELLLDEGLGLHEKKDGKTYGTEFDLDDLLRMDSATQVKTLTEGLKGVYSSNEARKKLNLPPTAGGAAVLSQQQNFSLAALAKRDARDDPFASEPKPAATPPAEDPANDDDAQTEAAAAKALLTIHKGLAHV